MSHSSYSDGVVNIYDGNRGGILLFHTSAHLPGKEDDEDDDDEEEEDEEEEEEGDKNEVDEDDDDEDEDEFGDKESSTSLVYGLWHKT